MNYKELLKNEKKMEEIENCYKENSVILENSYIQKICNAERMLRELRWEKEKRFKEFEKEENPVRNKEYIKCMEDREVLCATLYLKYMELSGEKKGYDFLENININPEVYSNIKSIIQDKSCKLYYGTKIEYSRRAKEKNKYLAVLFGKVIIPNRALLYREIGERYYFLDGIKDIVSNLPACMKPSNEFPLGLYSINWIHNSFYVEFNVKDTKNNPKYRTCEAVASIIHEINSNFFLRFYTNGKTYTKKECKEFLEERIIREILEGRYDVNYLKFIELLEG